MAKGGRPRSKVARLAPGIRGTMDTQHCHEIIDTEEQVDTFTDNPPIQKYTVPDSALTQENIVPENLSSTSSKSVNHIVQHIRSTAPSGYKPYNQDTLVLSQFVRPLPPLSLSEFRCNLSEGVIDRPMELRCGHLYCAECLIKSATNFQELACQKCRFTTRELTEVNPLHSIILHSLASLQVICSCKRPVSLGQFASHAFNCNSEMARSGQQSIIITPLRKAALQREFQIPIRQTPSSTERKAACHTVRRMIESSSLHATN